MSKTKNFFETLRELREACSQLNEAIADLNVTLEKINAEENGPEVEIPKRDVQADKELIRQNSPKKLLLVKLRKCGNFFINSRLKSYRMLIQKTMKNFITASRR